VRRRPYSVILFDEIEKAHPDVFNVLLQLLDEGRLTDGQGRRVDFRNTLIILTSNIGSDIILSAEKIDDAWPQIDAILKATFRPEFLNRLDEIVMFHRLGKEEILSIVTLELSKIAKRLAERKIQLEVSPEARQLLADRGYDPAFGARPLKRTIQNLVQNELAKKVLAGEIREGGKIKIGAKSGELVIAS
jgi:ATP-dependent Clp protease ATP-binding subunit ClpB